MTRSRKLDVSKMASLVGNSAAHEALFPGHEYAAKEIGVYLNEATLIVSDRSWNADEIAEFRQKSIARATSEIRKRKGDVPRELADIAARFIEQFISQNMTRRPRKSFS